MASIRFSAQMFVGYGQCIKLTLAHQRNYADGPMKLPIPQLFVPSLSDSADKNCAVTSRKKSTLKTAAIIEGAMQEFLANGYAATSMDKVAAAAGVSKATVYSHFQDKASLFAAIVGQLAEAKFGAGFDPRDEVAMQGEPSVVLRRIAENVLQEADDDAQFCEFMRLIIGESGRFPELAEPYVQNVAKPMISGLTRYFGSQSGLQLSDPEATARMFAGTLIYFVLVQRVLRAEALMPMESDRIVNTLISSILPS
ncbi:MAG: TetR/AcrR family transcriptional regulator [Cyanobacteria bacterium P01_D01_bin.105]